ncbi:hypothetical protein BJ741DRAFT_576798 [Chytriomyces cf. hyalinus JEL632]|nr:hypothetical protein BJ741DRAFT_576798 [Chytriomyces cf. hyalinus JEL632]
MPSYEVPFSRVLIQNSTNSFQLKISSFASASNHLHKPPRSQKFAQVSVMLPQQNRFTLQQKQRPEQMRQQNQLQAQTQMQKEEKSHPHLQRSTLAEPHPQQLQRQMPENPQPHLQPLQQQQCQQHQQQPQQTLEQQLTSVNTKLQAYQRRHDAAQDDDECCILACKLECFHEKRNRIKAQIEFEKEVATLRSELSEKVSVITELQSKIADYAKLVATLKSVIDKAPNVMAGNATSNLPAAETAS